MSNNCGTCGRFVGETYYTRIVDGMEQEIWCDECEYKFQKG